jgi:hypothetical protein
MCSIDMQLCQLCAHVHLGFMREEVYFEKYENLEVYIGNSTSQNVSLVFLKFSHFLLGQLHVPCVHQIL